jgi:hypothetical protein
MTMVMVVRSHLLSAPFVSFIVGKARIMVGCLANSTYLKLAVRETEFVWEILCRRYLKLHQIVAVDLIRCRKSAMKCPDFVVALENKE